MGLIDDKIDIIDGGTEQFLKSLEGADIQLGMELLKIIARFVSGGELELKLDKLSTLDEDIIKAIASTDYRKAVGSYIPNFDAIKALNEKYHKLENGINVQDVLLEADKIKNFQSVVEAQLKGVNEAQIQITEIGARTKIKRVVNIPNDSLDQLVQPISEMIRQDILLGVSFESATENILQAITKKQLGLERWAGTIARDALAQADGIQQQAIAEEFDLKYYRYVGTIKDTTRPLCYHMLTQKEEPVYTDEELKGILGEYAPAGIPSESRTTETANGKEQRKGSGIIPGTTPSNFVIRRGGYGCRHQYIPTAVK